LLLIHPLRERSPDELSDLMHQEANRFRRFDDSIPQASEISGRRDGTEVGLLPHEL